MLEEFEAECPTSQPPTPTIRTDDPGFKHIFEESEASLGPVSLSRGNSLSEFVPVSLSRGNSSSELFPVSLSRGNSLFESVPVSLSRGNSLSDFNLVEMYSGQELPDTDYTFESQGEGLFKLF